MIFAIEAQDIGDFFSLGWRVALVVIGVYVACIPFIIVSNLRAIRRELEELNRKIRYGAKIP